MWGVKTPPLSSRIACPREDGGGDPSFLLSPKCHSEAPRGILLPTLNHPPPIRLPHHLRRGVPGRHPPPSVVLAHAGTHPPCPCPRVTLSEAESGISLAHAQPSSTQAPTRSIPPTKATSQTGLRDTTPSSPSPDPASPESRSCPLPCHSAHSSFPESPAQAH